MTAPLFSIVTITLNNQVGLAETHASIAAQTCTDFEWIVIDGASSDGTIEYIGRQRSTPCKWISEPDNGIYDAMNKGLDRVIGRYIIFMNSGDRFSGSNVLSRIAAVLDGDAVSWDLLFGDALEEAAGGNLLLKRARPARFVSYGMFTHHQAMLYARQAITGMRYNSKYVIAGDYEFTCRLLARGASSLRLGFPISINKRAGLSEKKAGIGRRENLKIQETILRLGIARRTANYGALFGSSLVRTYARGLYDWLRFRRGAPLNDVC